ncbi:fam-b protein [Plasmodium vinckei]|uniref:Fam-b protein n=1 Tax=Plasmodium vinckei TaxID=5860 RepID=A0A6V7T774_PLAVN|nr:fam-b protein [Plasmodium vinckei]
MNKRIFSLVCILFYVFMAVSIYCSEQKDDRSKESGLRNDNHEVIDSITFYSDKYKKMKYRQTYCCGLFTEYRYPGVSYNSYIMSEKCTKLINNRILADADNRFYLNNFYESTLNLANQFSDYIDDDKEITNLRNNIDSHIKKDKESNISPNLNNVDEKTKNLIYELQKELEEVKKELDNKRNS